MAQQLQPICCRQNMAGKIDATKKLLWILADFSSWKGLFRLGNPV